jgi:hypothetical protein
VQTKVTFDHSFTRGGLSARGTLGHLERRNDWPSPLLKRKLGKVEFRCFLEVCYRLLHRPALTCGADLRAFSRVQVDLGWCNVCDAEKAVYGSTVDRVSIYEQCYARLVREWNGREGCGEQVGRFRGFLFWWGGGSTPRILEDPGYFSGYWVVEAGVPGVQHRVVRGGSPGDPGDWWMIAPSRER